MVPGRLVSIMSSWAKAIAISFEASRYYLKHSWLTETGMPLRVDLRREVEHKVVSTSVPFSILVTGGSRGAQYLNDYYSAEHYIRLKKPEVHFVLYMLQV